MNRDFVLSSWVEEGNVNSFLRINDVVFPDSEGDFASTGFLSGRRS